MKVPYIWTKWDSLVAFGGTTESDKQGTFVTPYGLTTAGITDSNGLYVAKGLKPGAECVADLNCSAETWRYERFYDLKDGYVWTDFSKLQFVALPDEVTTIAELCAHLLAQAPDLYPAELYAPDLLKDPPEKDKEYEKRRKHNIARAIFDFWNNSACRSAILESDKWSTYRHAPGDLPVRQGDFKITCAPAVRDVARAIAAAPSPEGTNPFKIALPEPPTSSGGKLVLSPEAIAKATTAAAHSPIADVETYIEQLEKWTGKMNRLFHSCDKEMRRRYSELRNFTALKDWVRLATDNGARMHASAIAVDTLLEELIPIVEKRILDLPVVTGARGTEAAAVLTSDRAEKSTDTSLNVAEDVLFFKGMLRPLLLDSQKHVEVIQRWLDSNEVPRPLSTDTVPSGPVAIPVDIALRFRLSAAVEQALYAYGHAGGDEADQVDMARMLDALKYDDGDDGIGDEGVSPARKIDTKSPVEVLVKYAGTARSINRSFGAVNAVVAEVQLKSELGAIARRLDTGVLTVEHWKDAVMAPVKRILRLLPHSEENVNLKADLLSAIFEGDSKTVRKIGDEFIHGMTIADQTDELAAMSDALSKCPYNLVEILLFFNALKDAVNARPDEVVLKAVSVGVSGANLILGTYSTVLKALGTPPNSVAWLARSSGCVSAIGAMTGIITGLMGAEKAYKAGDVLGVVDGAVTVTGGIAGVAASVSQFLQMVPNPATKAIALACALVNLGIGLLKGDKSRPSHQLEMMRLSNEMVTDPGLLYKTDAALIAKVKQIQTEVHKQDAWTWWYEGMPAGLERLEERPWLVEPYKLGKSTLLRLGYSKEFIFGLLYKKAGTEEGDQSSWRAQNDRAAAMEVLFAPG